MFEPESERDRLLQQQSGVLIFEAAVWADQGSGPPGTLRRQGAAAFSFWRAGPNLHRCAPQWRAPTGQFGEFRSENRSIGCRSESERLTVEVGWTDQERLRAVFRNSLICSQSKIYKIYKRRTRINISPPKTGLPLFGDPLASITLLSIFLLRCEFFRKMRRRGVGRPTLATQH